MSEKRVNLIPVGKRIIIEPTDPTKETEFGIVIPATASEERPTQGTVIAVGPLVGKREKDSCCCEDSSNSSSQSYETPIKVGAKVLFSKYSPSEIEYEGKKYLIISENDVLAVIE